MTRSAASAPSASPGRSRRRPSCSRLHPPTCGSARVHLRAPFTDLLCVRQGWINAVFCFLRGLQGAPGEAISIGIDELWDFARSINERGEPWASRFRESQPSTGRRELPPGGVVPVDSVFQGARADGTPTDVRVSELFPPAKDSLVIYSFMF